MKISLRTRLVLSFFAVIVVTAGLVVVLANRITAERFSYLVSITGQMQARRLAPLFASYYARVGSWDGVDVLLEEFAQICLSSRGRGWRVGVRGMMAGQCEEEAIPMPMADVVRASGDRLLLADTSGQVVADSENESAGLRLSAADLDKGAVISVGGRPVGTLIVATGLGTLTPGQTDFLSQVNRLMIVAAVVAGLAVLLVGTLQARRIVAPVRALAAAARRASTGEFEQIPVTSQDELGEMAVAFNAMAAALAEQQELRRRAMADVAHELRTPLSVLQIDLESIEDGLTVPTPEIVARLQEEVALLNRLVEDLRTLSLADAGELRMNVVPVDVAAMVEAAADRIRVAAHDKGVGLEVALPEPLPEVHGDEQRLAQVLFNLLSNGLRHTPAGGRITIAARREGEAVQVTVRDTGEGIPADELAYVFERFYRTDQARSRDTGGSGLGLAIVRGVVAAHGGRVWAESVEGEGSCFGFALPIEHGAAGQLTSS